MTGPRDWDKELAAVDKAIQKMKAPLNPPPASTPSSPRQPVIPAPREHPRGGRVATWLRVILVLLLGAAAPFWPYPRQCGLNLFLYLGVIALVVIAGIWGAGSSWNRRMGLPHVLSILTIIWGLALIAAEVLPRIGYAAAPLGWGC
jgi:hypothetical protein